LADLPVAGYPLVLRAAVPRYRCTTVDCGRTMFNQDLGKLAAPRASTARRCARYVLRRLLIDRTTIILPGARIGENAVIGANAAVAGEIPPYTVAVGIPARVIREIRPSINTARTTWERYR
jgi:hypothetical protein